MIMGGIIGRVIFKAPALFKGGKAFRIITTNVTANEVSVSLPLVKETEHKKFPEALADLLGWIGQADELLVPYNVDTTLQYKGCAAREVLALFSPGERAEVRATFSFAESKILNHGVEEYYEPGMPPARVVTWDDILMHEFYPGPAPKKKPEPEDCDRFDSI